MILDVGLGRLLVFDQDGAPVTSFGRPGPAPSEMGFPTQIRVEGDTIELWDGRQFTRKRFLRDGKFLGAERIGRSQIERLFPDAYTVEETRLAESGGLLFRGIFLAAPEPGRIRPRERLIHAEVGLGNPTTLLDLPGREQLNIGSRLDPDIWPAPIPKVTIISVGGQPERIVVATNNSDSLRVVDMEGRTISHFSTGIPTRRVRTSDRKRWERDFGTMTLKGMDPPARERVLSSLETPEEFPPIESVIVDPEGRIWVGERRRWDSEEVEVKVFDFDVSRVGSAQFPIHSRVLDLGVDRVALLVPDSIGIQRVEVYGFHPSPDLCEGQYKVKGGIKGWRIRVTQEWRSL